MNIPLLRMHHPEQYFYDIFDLLKFFQFQFLLLVHFYPPSYTQSSYRLLIIKGNKIFVY